MLRIKHWNNTESKELKRMPSISIILTTKMNLQLKTSFLKMENKLQMPNKKKEKKTISNGHKIKMKFLLVNMDNSKVSEQEVVLNY